MTIKINKDLALLEYLSDSFLPKAKRQRGCARLP